MPKKPSVHLAPTQNLTQTPTPKRSPRQASRTSDLASNRKAARVAVLQLSEFLSEKRKAAGLSQAEVAKALGYSTAQFVSNWERAQSAPPMSALPVLASLYRFKPEQLVQLLIEAAKEQVETSLHEQFQSLQNSVRRSR